MLKLKLQYSWLPDWKNWLTGKYYDAGKDWSQEEKGMTEDEIDGWMASLTLWAWVWAKLCELVMDREAWWAVVWGVTKGQIWLSDWPELLVN